MGQAVPHDKKKNYQQVLKLLVGANEASAQGIQHGV
jgi:hypothetical protein